MSRFTTEVRFICESYAGLTESKGFDDIEDIIETAAPMIFGDFPIYDESYRLVLEKKILRHYYTREISEETVGLWKLRLMDKMCMIMPFYNKLYESELLSFNPFYDVDLTRDYTRKDDGKTNDSRSENSIEKMNRVSDESTDGTSVDRDNRNVMEIENGNTVNIESGDETQSGNSKNTGFVDKTGVGSEKDNSNRASTKTQTGGETHSKNQWDLYSDTPQGGVTGIENATNPSVLNYAYLTNARNITDTDTLSFNNRQEGVNENSTGNKNNNYQENETNQNNQEYENVNAKNLKTEESKENNVSKQESGNVERSRNESKSGSYNDSVSRGSQSIGQNVVSSLSEYIEHVIGKQGGHTFSKMLLEFRDTFLNIDAMIIKDLEPLFFGLWE